MLNILLWCAALILVAASLCTIWVHAIKRKSETFDLSPYREPQRDERTDNIVDFADWLKASRARNAGYLPGEPRAFYLIDTIHPRHSGAGVSGVRDNRQLDSSRTSLHGLIGLADE